MLWTTKELAKAVGITPHQISYLVRIGKIKAVRVGHSYAILDQDAKSFIEAYKTGKASESADDSQTA